MRATIGVCCLCASVIVLSAAEVPTGSEAGALDVRVRLRPLVGAWRAGESPTLTVDIYNFGRDYLRVPQCRTLVVLKIDGQEYVPYGPSSPPYVAGLAPLRWSKPFQIELTDRWRNKRDRARLNLAPGKHRVRVALEIDRLAGGDGVRAESNSVDIEIVPAELPEGKPVAPAAREAQARRLMAARGRKPKLRFGIYLVADPIAAPKLHQVNIEMVRLGDVPVISEHDLVEYDWDAHALTLSSRALKRLPSPRLWGLPFVVVADGRRCYLGAFWTHISSYLPRIPVCYTGPLGGSLAAKNAIQIDPPPIAGAADPRADPRIRACLEALGKLNEPAVRARKGTPRPAPADDEEPAEPADDDEPAEPARGPRVRVLEPGSPRARAWLEARKSIEGCDTFIREHADLRPFCGKALLRKAELLTRSGRRVEAVRVYQAAIKQYGDELIPAINTRMHVRESALMHFGVLVRDLGRREEAKGIFERLSKEARDENTRRAARTQYLTTKQGHLTLKVTVALPGGRAYRVGDEVPVVVEVENPTNHTVIFRPGALLQGIGRRMGGYRVFASGIDEEVALQPGPIHKATYAFRTRGLGPGEYSAAGSLTGIPFDTNTVVVRLAAPVVPAKGD